MTHPPLTPAMHDATKKVFKLIFTTINAMSEEIIEKYETYNHGWNNPDDFLRSIQKKNSARLHKIENGYVEEWFDIGVIRKVEVAAPLPQDDGEK